LQAAVRLRRSRRRWSCGPIEAALSTLHYSRKTGREQARGRESSRKKHEPFSPAGLVRDPFRGGGWYPSDGSLIVGVSPAKAPRPHKRTPAVHRPRSSWRRVGVTNYSCWRSRREAAWQAAPEAVVGSWSGEEGPDPNTNPARHRAQPPRARGGTPVARNRAPESRWAGGRFAGMNAAGAAPPLLGAVGREGLSGEYRRHVNISPCEVIGVAARSRSHLRRRCIKPASSSIGPDPTPSHGPSPEAATRRGWHPRASSSTVGVTAGRPDKSRGRGRKSHPGPRPPWGVPCRRRA
jgi:hypothetical protein